MVDFTTEKPIPLSHAARQVPNRTGGSGVNIATVWRWCSRGVRGIRLETVCIGGVRMTSAEALARFFERLTAANNRGAVTTDTPAQKKHAVSKAEAELAEAGI